MVSAIIPSRNSPFLIKTIEDILSKASGDIEVIVNIDEKYPDKLLHDKRVTYIHPSEPKGMRWGINAGLALAKGKYVMKCDDHCMFAPGFDKVLSDNCQENWVVIPRRYSLDAENWKINETRPYRDYHYLCFPRQGKDHDWGMHGVDWFERGKQRSDPQYDIDDTMSFQGSCWFANKDYFMKIVGYLDDRVETYSTFAQEPQEIGLKYWLKGGENKVVKKTWYAHLHKGKQYGRMYIADYHTVSSHNWSARHWMKNEEPGLIHPISWLVDKFAPVPTWEPNWQEIWKSYNL
jgi:glycosyltransferase involved in cell wall biosynthesis